MDSFSGEPSLPSRGESGSHASRLYIYRLLQLAASTDAADQDSPSPSYQAVKRLARRLGVDSREKLVALFRDFRLGKLELEIGGGRVVATVSSAAGVGTGSVGAGNGFIGAGTGSVGSGSGFLDARSGLVGDVQGSGGCELERGLLDGSLEFITGSPVATVETQCRHRGDACCRFEAVAAVPRGIDLENPIGAAGFQNGIPHKSAAHPNGLQSWFMDLVARELARSRRHGRQLTFMYIDLDDLGRINEMHGRAAGDQVIKAVGTVLSRGCRTEDFIWHHGEDEFALLLSETGADGAHVVARRLSTEVLAAAEYVDVAARISASIGFSTFPQHADSVPGLFESARSAVYLAKSLGKGRAQIARRVQESAAADSEAGVDRRESRPQAEVESAAPAGQAGAEAGRVTEPAAGREQLVANVVIASSSPLLMAGIRHVFDESEGFRIVAEVSDSGRLPIVIADQRPDMIFADMEMATDGDFAVLKLLQKQNLPSKFSAFAADVDQDVIKLAADYNVDGVIMQDSAPPAVIAALTKIFEGKKVLPPEVRDAMKELDKNRRLLKELSEREIEVLRLVAEGKSNAQISNELFITVNTVRFHLANIYQKLSVSNRTEAANYYLRQDLTPDGQTRLL